MKIWEVFAVIRFKPLILRKPIAIMAHGLSVYSRPHASVRPLRWTLLFLMLWCLSSEALNRDAGCVSWCIMSLSLSLSLRVCVWAGEAHDGKRERELVLNKWVRWLQVLVEELNSGQVIFQPSEERSSTDTHTRRHTLRHTSPPASLQSCREHACRVWLCDYI